VAVVLFFTVGEFLEERAVDKSRRSIKALMDIRPDRAILAEPAPPVIASEAKQSSESSYIMGNEVPAKEVELGQHIMIMPGMRVPLDSVIVSGTSELDKSALTGESIPVPVEPGDSVLAGCVNGGGLLVAKVKKLYGESAASRIIALVENAENAKAKTENFITKFARVYTPIVVIAALTIAILPPVLGVGTFADWVYRGLVFLVVSCPCALVISRPLGFFGGIGGASAQGILVKGGNYLEALAHVDTVVFDKTGTLTEGRFEVGDIIPAQGFTKDEVLRLAAYAERASTHPIAVSIVAEYASRHPEKAELDTQAGGVLTEVPGKGVKAVTPDGDIIAGNMRMLEDEGIGAMISLSEGSETGVIYIAFQGRYAGMVLLSDVPKQDAAQTVEGLANRGISRVFMLTGDTPAAAKTVARKIGIENVSAELLPGQKLEALEDIMKSSHGKTAFMGDGINDAPVLARADVGIAMGGLGSDAAIEAADVVIMNDKPSGVLTAIDIAKKTRKVVKQNIALALIIKAAVLVLAALGLATMWEAVFADVGVALIATLNALRAGKTSNLSPRHKLVTPPQTCHPGLRPGVSNQHH
jgi:Cd2+/Zn2+-exporting ATPase